MLKDISKLMGKLVLSFFGWDYEFDKTGIKSSNNSFVIFPHTSIFDVIIIIFYFLTVPDELQYLYIMMKPQIFEYPILSLLLPLLHCIKCPRNEERCSGFTNTMIENYAGKHFKILISPKGTTEYRDTWRSGFWTLSQKLDTDIIAFALDYQKKKLVYLGAHKPVGEKHTFIASMKDVFSVIPQFHRSCEYKQEELFRNLSIIELLPFDPVVLSNNLTTVLSLFLASDMFFPFLIIFVNSIVSTVYHYSSETIWRLANSVSSRVSLFLLFLLMFNMFTFDWVEITILFLVFTFYQFGCGRHRCNSRTVNYIIFHSLFHLMFPLLLSKLRYN